MKKLVLVILCVVFTNAAFSQETKIQKDIKELLVLTGSAKLGIQVASQMISSFKQYYPDVPSTFWDEFLNEINEDALIDLIVPIYEKHYTHSEVKELIAFYKTPIGKKTIAILPQLTQDSMVAGQKWGKELGEQIAERLKEKGFSE